MKINDSTLNDSTLSEQRMLRCLCSFVLFWSRN